MVNEVFGQLQLIMGRKFSSRFGSKADVAKTKRMWAKGFLMSHVTAEATDHAINRIITSKMEWPPELPEFLELCEEHHAEGLPTQDQALKELLNRRGKYRFSESFTWSHRLVEYINEQIGDYLSKESEASFNKRFVKAYKEAVQLVRLAKLPPARKALPAPDLPALSNGVEVNQQCPMQKRLAELRALSGSKS